MPARIGAGGLILMRWTKPVSVSIVRPRREMRVDADQPGELTASIEPLLDASLSYEKACPVAVERP